MKHHINDKLSDAALGPGQQRHTSASRFEVGGSRVPRKSLGGQSLNASAEDLPSTLAFPSSGGF